MTATTYSYGVSDSRISRCASAQVRRYGERRSARSPSLDRVSVWYDAYGAGAEPDGANGGEADRGAPAEAPDLVGRVERRRRGRSIGIDEVELAVLAAVGARPGLRELLAVGTRRVAVDLVGVAALQQGVRAPQARLARRPDGAARLAHAQRRARADDVVRLHPPQGHAQRRLPGRAALPAVHEVVRVLGDPRPVVLAVDPGLAVEVVEVGDLPVGRPAAWRPAGPPRRRAARSSGRSCGPSRTAAARRARAPRRTPCSRTTAPPCRRPRRAAARPRWRARASPRSRARAAAAAVRARGSRP